jgi:hypothetical protein
MQGTSSIQPSQLQKKGQQVKSNNRGSTYQQIQSASGSNTGGQPSPIGSTKRVPQKILAQRGDTSISPPNSKGPKNIFGVL